MVAVTLDAFMDYPCPRVGVTITGLGTGTSVVSVWRISEGKRNEVPGFRRVLMTDADYVVDFFAPLGVPVKYEVEVMAGPSGAARVTSAPTVLGDPDSPVGYIMDALVPQTAIPLVGRRDGQHLTLTAASLSELESAADVSMYDIVGSNEPMALFSQRMAERGVPFQLAARSAEQNAQLKNLLASTANLHFRPAPAWEDPGIDPQVFISTPRVRKTPVTRGWGDRLAWWDLNFDVVRAPAVRVMTATFTYGDVAIMFSTYQDKLDAVIAAAAAAGEAPTYLFDLKKPLG
ncbi:hypothetical protein ACIPY0_12205 [Paenarthrobacter nicotinovorans]|uniref:hypothetical protein n=1 Tax=Paenarthrobacter nicotinovorans TaxID=29320 RepID=UPI003824893A